MDNVRGVWKDQEGEQPRHVDHISVRALDPAALARFYVDVFELQEVEKSANDPNSYVTDGKISMIFTPWRIEDYHGTEHRGPGYDHVGFTVESIEDFQSDLNLLAEVDPAWMSSKSPNLESEHKVIADLLSDCPLGHDHFIDPDGNMMDVVAT